MWSSWIDAEQATAEIDHILSELRAGREPRMGILFAPTGPMQELALSSGWSDEFEELAVEFETATAGCACLSAVSNDLEPLGSLGTDRHFAEIALLRCPKCGQRWVRYFYENESFTRSGRWYLGAVDSVPEPEQALVALGSLPWYFAGGSYFDGEVRKMSGPITL